MHCVPRLWSSPFIPSPPQTYAKTLVAFVNPDGSTDSTPGGIYMGEWFRGQRTGTGRFMFDPASKFKTYSGACDGARSICCPARSAKPTSAIAAHCSEFTL